MHSDLSSKPDLFQPLHFFTSFFPLAHLRSQIFFFPRQLLPTVHPSKMSIRCINVARHRICPICLLCGRVVSWRCLVECRTCDQDVMGSTLGWAHGVKTLGEILTPVCLCSPSSTRWYRPKGGDALRLGSNGRYGLCGWQVKLCDPLITHGPYLSALEVQHDKALYKSTFTILYLLYFVFVLCPDI